MTDANCPLRLLSLGQYMLEYEDPTNGGVP